MFHLQDIMGKILRIHSLKFLKISGNILTKDELNRWISDKPTKAKTRDTELEQFTFFSKGLSYRVKLYDIPDPDDPTKTISKFGTLILLKDGKIELKASWDESMKANLAAIKSVITIFRGVVQEINKLQYHMLGTNRKRLIGLPDPDFIGNPYSNTQLTLINSSTYVEYGEGANINFNDLNALAQCFHKTYATVIRTDINLVQPQAPGGIIKTVATESSTLKLRYKRISFYEEMDKYSKFIYELKQQYRTRLDKATIITIFKEEFKGENMTKENAEIIVDAILSKKIKHPGIDVRVRKSEDNENLYKIFILGAKNLLQLSQVHFYIKQLLYVFKNRSTEQLLIFNELE